MNFNFNLMTLILNFKQYEKNFYTKKLIVDRIKHFPYEVNQKLKYNKPLGENFTTPLIEAILNNNFYVIKILLKCKNIDVNITDTEGKSALDHAIETKNLDLLNLLLSHDNIIVNKKDVHNETPLTLSLISNKMLNVLLQHKNTDVNMIGHNGENILIHIFKNHSINIDQIKLILNNKNLNINHQDDDENTALLILAHMPHKISNDLMILLLNNDNIDFNIRNNKGDTVLHEFINSFKITHDCYIFNIISMLFNHKNKIDTNIKNNEGDTPLIRLTHLLNISSQIHDDKSMKLNELLLKNNANPSIKNNKGETAIMISLYWANNNNYEHAKLLILYQDKHTDKFIKHVYIISKYLYTNLTNLIYQYYK